MALFGCEIVVVRRRQWTPEAKAGQMAEVESVGGARRHAPLAAPERLIRASTDHPNFSVEDPKELQRTGLTDASRLDDALRTRQSAVISTVIGVSNAHREPLVQLRP